MVKDVLNVVNFKIQGGKVFKKLSFFIIFVIPLTVSGVPQFFLLQQCSGGILTKFLKRIISHNIEFSSYNKYFFIILVHSGLKYEKKIMFEI